MERFSGLMTDMWLAWRTLWRSPAFSLGSVVMMAGALGIGAAAFGVVSSVVPSARALPGLDRVVGIAPTEDGSVLIQRGLTRADASELRALRLPSLVGIAEVGRLRSVVSSGAVSRPAWVETLHGDLFALFGVRPAFGRPLNLSTEPGSADAGVWISDRLAKQLFGLPEAAIGQTVYVSGQMVTVAGVAPESFLGVTSPTLLGADVWVARQAFEHLPDVARRQKYGVFSRLAPTVSVEQANRDLQAVGLGAVPAQDALMPLPLAALTWTASGAVVFVTLALIAVAGANLAGLMLARSNARATEVAVRVTLGASRWRVMRLFLSESVLLLAVAALVGGLLASGLVVALSRWSSPEISGVVLVSRYLPDWRLSAFTGVFAVVVAATTGLWSARRAVMIDPARQLLASGGATMTATLAQRASQLVTLQFAVSTVLLLAAAVSASTTQAQMQREPGFQTSGVAIARVDYRLQGIEPSDWSKTNEQLLATAQAVVGARPAALVSGLPLDRDGAFGSIPGHGGTRYVQMAGDGFGALGISIRGRGFDLRDQPSTPPVAVVSENLAAELWPDGTALGRPLTLWAAGRNRVMTVVGIAGNTNGQSAVREQRRTVYMPLSQLDSPAVAILIQAPEGAESAAPLIPVVRSAFKADMPTIALLGLRTLDDELGVRSEGLRLAAVVLVATGGFALLITWVGLYAATSYLVGRRLREFGLMRALGAGHVHIYRAVLAPILRTVLTGAVSGTLVSLVVLVFARHYLVGFGTAGLGLILAIPAALTMVVLVAALIPARRASRLEPLSLLRQL